MMRGDMLRRMLTLAVAASMTVWIGCQGSTIEGPEMLTGQRHASDSGGARYEWGGKGLQWGRVVRDGD